MLNVALPFYLTWWYALALSVAYDMVLLFGGLSMVLAALRGYAGCEMLVLSELAPAQLQPDRQHCHCAH